MAVFDVGGMLARSRIRALYFPKETQEACEEEMESGTCHEVLVHTAQVISNKGTSLWVALKLLKVIAGLGSWRCPLMLCAGCWGVSASHSEVGFATSMIHVQHLPLRLWSISPSVMSDWF